MTTIGKLMSRARLVTVGPATLTSDAARKSIEEGVSHLMVTDGDSLLGVCCVCDLDAADLNSAISQCMSTNLVTASADTDAAEAVELMQSRGVSCLPVLVAGKLHGVVTLANELPGY
jgi:CBS domain-containing protein